MSYSQNGEDLFVRQYFGFDFKGTLLEIGANDGVTLSNSKLLIDNGWRAHLIEPGKIFSNLFFNHTPNSDRVSCYHYGIGEKDETVNFYESGCHVANGKDTGLVSTCDFNETLKWRKQGVEFSGTNVKLVSFDRLYQLCGSPTFDFISIDAEGYDWIILQQINLTAVGCRCLCIEWNSDPKLLQLFTNYCTKFGMKEAVRNAENLIFTL